MKLTPLNILKEWISGTEIRQKGSSEQVASHAEPLAVVGPLSGLSRMGKPRELTKTRPQGAAVSALFVGGQEVRGKDLANSSEPAPELPRRYRTVGMRRAGLDKDLNNAVAGKPVPYLLERERTAFLVSVIDGRLCQNIDGRTEPLDTKGAVNPADHYLFVMDERGRIFAASSKTVTHHSAFLSGNPVAASGSLKVEQGRLVALTDQSGHYASPREYSDQFVTEIKRRGVDMSAVKVDYVGSSKKEIKKKARALGVNFVRLYPEGPKKKNY